MAAIQHPLDIYKVPRALVNVEVMAQGLSRYLQMTAEDSEVLSQDPTRRDKLIAELYKQPGLKSGPYASQFVSDGEDPDAYLGPADAEIAKLTPPKSFEDRIIRLHIAFPAMMVFQQYKIDEALRGLPDLQRKVDRRVRDIMDEWHRTDFDIRFPPRPRGVLPSRMQALTRTTRPPSPTPLSSRDSPKRMSEDEMMGFLNSPHTMIGKQFVQSPPRGQGGIEEDSGTWEVISYLVKKADSATGVDHEFQILLHDQVFGADPMLMDMEEVRYLLLHSTLAV